MNDTTPRATRRGLGANYRRLLAANVVGNLGDGIAVVALPWYASTLTTDPLAIAAVAMAGRLPWLLLALIAGAVGDRVDRRRLMVGSMATKSLVLFSLAALVLLDVAGIAVVVALSLLIGVCEVFFDNAGQTMIPAVVDRDRLERANGTMWAAETLTQQFLGPPLGGALIAVSLATPFAVQALLACSAALLLVTLRGRFRAGARAAVSGEPDAHEAPAGIMTMVVEGLRWLWGHRLLRTLAVVLGLINGAGAATSAVLVLFAQDVLGLDSRAFGLVLTAGAVGAVMGAIVTPALASRVRPGVVLAGTCAVHVVGTLAIALTPVVAVFVGAYVVSTFTTVWWNVVTVSLRQRLIPDRLLSRVNSAYRMLGWGAIPIGTAFGGVLVSLAEGPVGREWALRLPYFLEAVMGALLVVICARYLNTPAIRAAERAATDLTTGHAASEPEAR